MKEYFNFSSISSLNFLIHPDYIFVCPAKTGMQPTLPFSHISRTGA